MEFEMVWKDQKPTELDNSLNWLILLLFFECLFNANNMKPIFMSTTAIMKQEREKTQQHQKKQSNQIEDIGIYLELRWIIALLLVFGYRFQF